MRVRGYGVPAPSSRSDAISTPSRSALASSRRARIASSESRAGARRSVDHRHAVPISRASSKVETPAASASVANVWRRWYGPRLAIPAASSAGYHSRVRQLSRSM